MANEINPGDVRRLSVTDITDTASAQVVDPTTLTLTIRKPDLTLTTYTFGSGDNVIVKDSVGNYHADISLDQSGTWLYDWQGTGTAEFAEGASFWVSASRTG